MGACSKAPDSRVLGRYVLHGQLAAGGMATVHLARLNGEAGFARTVAIKRLHPQFAKDPEFVAMFVDEARLAARIRHPNVVPTLDVISDTASALDGEAADGEIFLVMEYVPGESLSRLLRALKQQKGHVPPRIAATLLAGVLHGLHAAHEAKSEKGTPLGMVHRDVSPQNVLVGVDGIAHVLDFGVAKATGSVHTTREGQIKGKLGYMAPEQFESGALTRKSDIYAAAVVLWETLTLTRLFEGETEAALLMKVVAGKTPAPSSLVPGGLPKGLDEIVLRGLSRDPAARWATARDFAIALEKCVPIVAPSDIGEWVQAIAGDEIARRARMVSDIERGSYPMSAAAPVESEAQKSEVRISSSMRSAGTSIPVSHVEPVEAPIQQARGGKAYFFAGGLSGLLLVLVVMVFMRLGGAPKAAGSRLAPAAGPATALHSAPSDVKSAPVAAPAPPDETPGAEHGGWAPEVKSPAAPVPVASQSPSPSPAPPSAPPRSAARPRSDCDPPFTRDAVGHKHYKLQCL